VQNQAAVLEMQKQSLSLEDIFKALTNWLALIFYACKSQWERPWS
jgi:hypothetical protein